MNAYRTYRYTEMQLADANALRAIAHPTPETPTLTEAELRSIQEQADADARAWEEHLEALRQGA